MSFQIVQIILRFFFLFFFTPKISLSPLRLEPRILKFCCVQYPRSWLSVKSRISWQNISDWEITKISIRVLKLKYNFEYGPNNLAMCGPGELEVTSFFN